MQKKTEKKLGRSYSDEKSMYRSTIKRKSFKEEKKDKKKEDKESLLLQYPRKVSSICFNDKKRKKKIEEKVTEICIILVS